MFDLVYVTSDLHGCPIAVLESLLQKAGFTDQDFLYILGDVIDRGAHSAELLLWLTQQPNMQLILGNHEGFLLSCQFLFQDVSEESLSELNEAQIKKMQHWFPNGGEIAMQGMSRLRKQTPELYDGIIGYLNNAPLYEELTIRGKHFILVHGGLGTVSPDKSMSDYTPHDLIWARPTLNDVYYTDKYTVFGHTPAYYLNPDAPDRAVKTDTWTCVDTGAAYGGNPMLLRLDDMAEFYL